MHIEWSYDFYTLPETIQVNIDDKARVLANRKSMTWFNRVLQQATAQGLTAYPIVRAALWALYDEVSNS